MLVALIATASAGAKDLQAGDFILRAGATHVVPNESTGGIHGPLSSLFNGASVSSDTQFGLTVGYMVTNHIDFELLAASPFKHDVGIQGGALAGTKLGSIKQLPPTLSVDYHFGTGTPIQPYVGVGVNYTIFYDEDLSQAAKKAGVTGLNLSNSLGPAAQVGVDWNLPDHWLLNADVRYLDIKTNAHVHTPGGDTKVNLAINPWVYTLAVGYHF